MVLLVLLDLLVLLVLKDNKVFKDLQVLMD